MYFELPDVVAKTNDRTEKKLNGVLGRIGLNK